LPPEETYSPLLHRINQVIAFRAVHPDKPLPPQIEVLTQYSHPPPELVKGAEKVIQNLIEAFNVKKGIPAAPVDHSRPFDVYSAAEETCETKENG
jgi:ATP-dependent DNA helicase 2 subunit 2